MAPLKHEAWVQALSAEPRTFHDFRVMAPLKPFVPPPGAVPLPVPAFHDFRVMAPLKPAGADSGDVVLRDLP